MVSHCAVKVNGNNNNDLELSSDPIQLPKIDFFRSKQIESNAKIIMCVIVQLFGSLENRKKNRKLCAN